MEAATAPGSSMKETAREGEDGPLCALLCVLMFSKDERILTRRWVLIYYTCEDNFNYYATM